MTATVIGIGIRQKPEAPFQTLTEAKFHEQVGIEGDYRRGGGRQVTILFKEYWEVACNETGSLLEWTIRRPNLFVEGMTLQDCKGLQLRVGDILLEVSGETTPCYKMDAAQDGLQAALRSDWRGGVTCRVLQSGTVQVGDEIKIVEAISAD